MLVGTNWRLTSNGVGSFASGAAKTLRLAANGSASGSAGCNTFRVTYSTEANTLAFGPIATTKKLCGAREMVLEHAYLGALGRVHLFSIEGTRMVLLGVRGRRLLIFAGSPP